jgi:hypothetical protein
VGVLGCAEGAGAGGADGCRAGVEPVSGASLHSRGRMYPSIQDYQPAAPVLAPQVSQQDLCRTQEHAEQQDRSWPIVATQQSTCMLVDKNSLDIFPANNSLVAPGQWWSCQSLTQLRLQMCRSSHCCLYADGYGGPQDQAVMNPGGSCYEAKVYQSRVVPGYHL